MTDEPESYESFSEGMLRRIAAAADVPYADLAKEFEVTEDLIVRARVELARRQPPVKPIDPRKDNGDQVATDELTPPAEMLVAFLTWIEQTKEMELCRVGYAGERHSMWPDFEKLAREFLEVRR